MPAMTGGAIREKDYKDDLLLTDPSYAKRHPSKTDEGHQDNVLDTWEAFDSDADSEGQTYKEGLNYTHSPRKHHIEPTKKTRAERIKEHEALRALEAIRRSQNASDSESEGERRARQHRLEEEADLRLAEDMLGFRSGPDLSSPELPSTFGGRGTVVDLGSLSVFNPETWGEFTRLRELLVPLISRNFSSPYYGDFLRELVLQLAGDLRSEDIRRVGSMMVRLANEKSREERGEKRRATKEKP